MYKKRRRAQYGVEAHNIRREGGRVATKETGLLRSFGGDRKTIVRLEFTTLGAPSPRVPLESTWSARPPWNGWVGVRLRKLPLRAARKLPLTLAPSLFPAEFKPAGRAWWDTRVSDYHTLTQESLRSHRWTTSVVAKCRLR